VSHIGNRRILVVDDMESIHEDFRKVLRPAAASGAAIGILESALFGTVAAPTDNFEIDHAFQGQEALAKVQAAIAAGRPYAMAFVDMRMPPGWDGVETIERLWQEDDQLQVVICTAFSDLSWEQVMQRLDMRDRLLVLKKPFDAIEVQQLASSLCKKWEVSRQTAEQIRHLETAARERIEWSMKLEQSARMEALGTMAAGIAHDFNTILGIINGYAEMLGDLFQSGSIGCENSDQIIAAAGRASGLISRMLAFARQRPIDPIPVDVAAQVANVVEMIRISLPPGVDLTLTSDLPQAWMMADPTQIDQLVMNLCKNACDAMQGHGKVGIEIRAARQRTGDREPVGRRFRLVVSDNGPGMDAELQRRVFDPFFTTKEPGQGSGLGLAVVYGIVADMAGEIILDSEPGKGARFEITLPLLDDDCAKCDQWRDCESSQIAGSKTGCNRPGAKNTIFPANAAIAPADASPPSSRLSHD